MKRRILSVLCLIGLLMSMNCAYAESVPVRGTAMTVVRCREYINLRTRPDTEAEDMCSIELYDTVVFLEDANEKFYLVGYNGMMGYANKKYLIPSEWMYAGKKTNTKISVVSVRNYAAEGEYAIFYAYNSSGKRLWKYETKTSYMTELTLISGFYAGTDEMPMFMVYNAEQGLTALDLESGRELWTLSAEEVQLGGSITWAVDEEGTMYIGGYYGPEPVAISAWGEVLWKGRSKNDDAYWLYDMWLTPDCIWARYEGGDGADILYDRENGKVR